jgi:hypothetical protein
MSWLNPVLGPIATLPCATMFCRATPAGEAPTGCGSVSGRKRRNLSVDRLGLHDLDHEPRHRRLR